MSRKRSRREDPLTYRIAYSRIAQELHARSGEGELREGDIDSIPATSVRDAIAAVQREVPLPWPAGAVEGDVLPRPQETGLAGLALALVADSRKELLHHGYRWVGRRPSRLRRLTGPWWRSRDPRLATFLASVIEPATVAIYFSVRVEGGWSPDFEPLPLPPEPVDRRGGRGGRDAKWLHSYLELIRSERVQISYRARYNLACLFSRSALRATEERSTEHYVREALHQMELCVAGARGRNRAAIQEWARKDPAFLGLRELAWRDFSRVLGAPPEDRQ